MPTERQYEMRAEALKKNLTKLVIEDLTKDQQEFYDEGSTNGIEMLNLLANVSRSLMDITIVNVLTTSRIERFIKIITKDDFFKNNLGQVGQFFQALLVLNFKVRMIPEYVPPIEDKVPETIKYRVEKMFDLDSILKILYDMDFASW